MSRSPAQYPVRLTPGSLTMTSPIPAGPRPPTQGPSTTPLPTFPRRLKRLCALLGRHRQDRHRCQFLAWHYRLLGCRPAMLRCSSQNFTILEKARLHRTLAMNIPPASADIQARTIVDCTTRIGFLCSRVLPPCSVGELSFRAGCRTLLRPCGFPRRLAL